MARRSLPSVVDGQGEVHEGAHPDPAAAVGQGDDGRSVDDVADRERHQVAVPEDGEVEQQPGARRSWTASVVPLDVPS